MVSAATPAITVVIPTYNWSSALRCAIRSVLLQTVQDFEVLIVGDGCTDDSAAVVAEFGDPRLRWHNLSQNYGSQWAPNNYANENAAGAWIAYLGHDDIWYPTHLEAILRTAQKTSAPIVSSVMIMIGPPGTGIRRVAGVFPTGTLSSQDFVPPSAFAHRKSVGKAVKWRDPHTIVPPTDVVFLSEAAAIGKIESTGELTCFKFNAAWRRDAYKTRSVAEQEAMLKLIESGVDFRQQAYLELVEAFVAGKAESTRMPQAKGLPEGWFDKANRRFKGLDSRHDDATLRHIDTNVRFDMAGQDMPFEWHELESHPQFGSFRWTGPSRRVTIDLPVVVDRDLAARIHILNAAGNALNTLKLSIHERPIAYRVSRLAGGSHLVEAHISRAAITGPQRDFGITLEIENTARPMDLSPTSEDSRWLGLAVNWVELEPA